MNRSELIAEIVERTGQTKKAVADMVDAYEETVYDAIRRNEVVALHGFLKFERRKRKGHKGNDLKNNGLIDIPDSESVKVTPGNTLKNVLRNSG